MQASQRRAPRLQTDRVREHNVGMSRRRSLLVLTVSLALFATTGVRPAAASTVVPVTVEALARRADDVLVVTPRRSTAHWIGRRIVTDYDLDVQAVVRGAVSPGAHVVLRAAGGTVGNIVQEIPGTPVLAIDRPYVVFLLRSPNVAGTYFFAHLMAAALPIVAAADGTPVALPAVEGMRVGPAAASASSPRASIATVMVREGLPLDALVRLLRSPQ